MTVQNDVFARGQSILLTGTFLDPNGVPVIPTSANAYVSYLLPEGVYTTDVLPLIQTATPNIWNCVWDSSVAADGTNYVYVHMRSQPIPCAANDFQFRLKSNQANPRPMFLAKAAFSASGAVSARYS